MGELNETSTYAWTVDSDKRIRISKSTLDTYSNWCAQQMWLGKVLPHADVEEKDYLTIGSNVHDRTEHFYNNGWDNTDVIDEAIADAKKGNYKSAREKLRGLFPDAEGDYADREQQYQDWLLDNDILRLKHCKDHTDFLPVGNELDLDAIIEVDVDGTTYEVHLRGIIDRIFKDAEGGVALMELKTGKWHNANTPKMKMEMAYYAYVLEQSGAADDLGDVTHYGWRYPKADHWDYMEMKKATLTAMKKRLHKLVRAYVEHDFPTTKDEFKCGYCDYIDFCPKGTPFENPVEFANGAEPIWKEGRKDEFPPHQIVKLLDLRGAWMK